MTNFTSAEEVYAIVKEELNSYFSSGVVTDIMFPKWTELAMARFNKSSMPIKVAYLPLDNYTAELPSDFDSVKSLWVCGLLYSDTLVNPSSYYYQKDCRITQIDDKCNECFDPCDNDLPKKDERYRVTHKITGVTHFDYYRSHLLRPGNNSAIRSCHTNCPNLKANSTDTFDIQGCKLQTSFREGSLHLEYYSSNLSEDGTIMIPDNTFMIDYLIKYLKFKVFEMISNTVSDESYNQSIQKMQMAENSMNIAREIVKTELKKLDKYQISDLIKQRKNRFSNYRRSIR